MSTVPTEQLVCEYLAGQQLAAAHLLERYGRMAYAVISHLLYTRGDRDDVYQEACLRAFRDLRSLEDPARFGGWFKQIAIRTAIDHMRRRRLRIEPLDERLPDRQPGPEMHTLQNAERQQVRQAVSRLPEHYRQVIVLFYWADCSYQEISVALDIPMGTVMSRLHKAKSLLSRELDSDNPQAKEEAIDGSGTAIAGSEARS